MRDTGMKLAGPVVSYVFAETTVNQEIFVLKNFHVIIFRVKIFSYTSRPYENILTTKNFQ